MDETAELNRLSGRAFAAMMGEAPGFEMRQSRDCTLGLSGEPVADLNMMFIGSDPDAERFLAEGLARCVERELPLLVVMTPHLAAELSPVAERLGLTPAGSVPLMVLRGSAPVRLGRMCNVKRALDTATVRAAGDLVAAAFELPRDSVARALGASLKETSAAETYVGLDANVAMSAVTVTRTGSTAGIWCMATPPEHQGKGMGRALLTRVIEHFRHQGVDRFYLAATTAGRPLYESIGFVTIADYTVWLRGDSTQMHA